MEELRSAVMARVRDGISRRLLIVAFSAYDAEKGFCPLPGVADEIAAVAAAFGELGYLKPRVWLDEPPSTTLREVYDELTEVGPDDVVTLYLTGHGEAVATPSGLRHYVHPTSSAPGLFREAFTVGDLLRGLARSALGRLVLLIDTCEAGASVGAAVEEARAWLASDGPADTPFTVVATARTGESATSGAFAEACRRAIEDGAAPREQPYLTMTALRQDISERLDGQRLDHVDWRVSEQDVALPNPRHHLEGIDPTDMRDWWEPRARGGSGSWLFTGRAAVMERLSAWCSTSIGPSVIVVTAAPGSGKSTVIARLVALTAPDLRRRHDALRDQVGSAGADRTLPDTGFRFATTIWARGRDVGGIRAQVSESLGLASDADLSNLSPPALGFPPVIAVDAVDEAQEPFRLVAEVLAPLARAAQGGALRLIVATRRSPLGADVTGARRRTPDLIRPLEVTDHETIDLDSARWLRQGDIAAYVDRVLEQPGPSAPNNPWADDRAARARLARAVERAALPSFLLAGSIARRHRNDTDPSGPEHPVWRRQFPTTIGQALREELEAACGFVRTERILTLLRPLGFALGMGLPRERVGDTDLWALLATVLSPGRDTVDAADIDELLNDRAATHLLATVDSDGHTTYRLHHQALVDFFAEPGPAGHTRVLDALLPPPDHARVGGWARIGSYSRRAIPGHAAACGRLQSIVSDPEAVVALEPEALYASLRGEPELAALHALMSPLLHRLRTADPSERAILVALAAAARSKDDLSSGLLSLAHRYGVAVRAVATRPGSRAVTLSDRGPGSLPVLLGAVRDDGDSVLVLGDGPFIEVWSPDDLEQLALLTDHDGNVRDLCHYVDDVGLPVLASIDDVGGLRVRDLDLRGGPRYEAEVSPGVRLLVAGRDVRGAFIAVATSEGVHVMHPDNRESDQDDPLDDTSAAIGLAVVSRRSGSDLLVIAAADTVSVWRPETASFEYVMAGRVGPSPSLVGEVIAGVDGRLLVLDSLEGSLWVWTPGEDPELLAPDDHPTCAAFVVDGRAVVGTLRGDVVLWDLIANRRVRRLLREGPTLIAIEVLQPIADRPGVIVAADRHGSITAWDASSGDWLVTHDSGIDIAGLTTGRHTDGEPFVATVGRTGVMLWELTPQHLHVLPDVHPGQIHDLVVHAAEDVVATLGDDATIRLWATPTGELLSIRKVGRSPYTFVLRSDANGLRAVIGGDDGIFDIALSGASSILALPLGSIYALAAAELDGRTVLAVGLRASVQLRAADSGELLGELDLESRTVVRILCLAAQDPRERALSVIVGCDFGVIQVWRWEPGLSSSVALTGWAGPVTHLAAKLEVDGRLEIVAAGLRGGTLQLVAVHPVTGESGPPRTLLRRSGSTITGLHHEVGGVAALVDAAGIPSVARWSSPDGPLNSAPLRAAVRGLSEVIVVRGDRWAVGWSTTDIVLVPLTGPLAPVTVPIPTEPEIVRVLGDALVVGTAGGYIALHVDPG